MALHAALKMAWVTLAELASVAGEERQILVVTDDYSLVVMDGVTVGGRARFYGVPLGGATVGYARSAPTDGATVTADAGERVRQLVPAGTLATLTVEMPPDPEDGQPYELRTSQAITALTVTSADAIVAGAPAGMAANSSIRGLYVAGDDTWYIG